MEQQHLLYGLAKKLKKKKKDKGNTTKLRQLNSLFVCFCNFISGCENCILCGAGQEPNNTSERPTAVLCFITSQLIRGRVSEETQSPLSVTSRRQHGRPGACTRILCRKVRKDAFYKVILILMWHCSVSSDINWTWYCKLQKIIQNLIL